MVTSVGYWDTSLLTIGQAAKLLNVHPDTLRRWERQGVLATVRVGSRKDRRYRHEDLLAMTQQDVTTNTPQQMNSTSNKHQIKKIQTSLHQASWIFFDVGYTLMALFQSRGDVYAEIAYHHGYNLNPLLIQQNFNKLEEEWNKEKILSHPVIHAFQPTVSEHYAQFNGEILMRSTPFVSNERRLAVCAESPVLVLPANCNDGFAGVPAASVRVLIKVLPVVSVPPTIKLSSVLSVSAAERYKFVSLPHTNFAVKLVGNVPVAIGNSTWLSKPLSCRYS